MMKRRVPAMLMIGAFLVLVGCSGPAQSGSTLNVLRDADFEHLDPARTYPAETIAFERLIYRTLTTYAPVGSGRQGTEVIGDLATGTGTPSNNAKTWTFQLKKGLRLETGETITCDNIKRNIGRSFDPAGPEGAPYMRDFLANVPDGYHGPTKSGDLPDESVACLNDSTIRFQLSQPIPDFPIFATFPYTAPVPLKQLPPQTDSQPTIASGPYRVEEHSPGKEIVLVRNRYWDPDSDSARAADPDRIVFTLGIEPSVIDQRMIADAGNDQSAVMFPTGEPGVQSADLPTIQSSPDLVERMDVSPTPGMKYIMVNTTKIPDIRVREAILHLIDKESILGTLGGAAAGKISNMITPSLVPGHEDYTAFPAPSTGDVNEAKRLLTESGVKLPLELTMVTSDSETDTKIVTAVQEALSRADVKLNVEAMPSSQYFTTIADPSKTPELIQYGWSNSVGMRGTLPVLFCGCQFTGTGNKNHSQLKNSKVDSLIKAAQVEPHLSKANSLWAQAEHEILDSAAVIPLLQVKQILMHGSNVDNASIHPIYGYYDLANIRLK